MQKFHFVFDEGKCVGCEACTIACMNENGFHDDGNWRTVFSYDHTTITKNSVHSYLSMACNHCLDAPCMKQCPSLAFYISEKTGAVLHNADHCIGCKYCIWNCPYEAPIYNKKEGVISKCNFCEHKLSENILTACVSSCPTKALEISEDEYAVTGLDEIMNVTEKKHSPSIIYKRTNNPEGPEFDPDLFKNYSPELMQIASKNRISLKQEWPLIIFSLVSIFMAILTTSDLVSNENKMIRIIAIVPVFFAAPLSLFHLGRKKRAWRAILNLKYSWLSREIFFFGILTFGLLTDLFFVELNSIILQLAALGLLISIDKVYKPLQGGWKTTIHADQTLFIALNIILVIHDQIQLMVVIFLFRFILLLIHNFLFTSDIKKGFEMNIIRLILLLTVATLMLLKLPMLYILPALLVSEILGRVIFYMQLQILSVTDLLKNGSLQNFRSH